MYLNSRHKDLLVLVAVVLSTYLLSLIFNIAEELNLALSKFESIQLDEIPLTLFALAIMSAWYSNRRSKELIVETNLRIETESHLRNSQTLYKTLFEGDLTGNCVLSLNGKMLVNNAAFVRICNTEHLQSVQHLFDFDWQTFTQQLTKANELNYNKLKIFRADGAQCYVIARFIYIQSGFSFHGQFEQEPQIHVYMVDITEQCLAELDLERSLKENQRLARHTIHIQEIERKFIAQEIHDETGQYLTSMRMDAMALKKADPQKTQEIAARIDSNIGHVQKSIYALIKQLRPIALDSQGLSSAIQQLFESWKRHHPTIEITFTSTIEKLNFLEEVNIVAFRIVQESLTNISKHAQAKQVGVHIRMESDRNTHFLTIEIKDNGIGVDFNKPSGLGMIGMRERVESLSGQFEVLSKQPTGTSILARIPISLTQASTHSPKELLT